MGSRRPSRHCRGRKTTDQLPRLLLAGASASVLRPLSAVPSTRHQAVKGTESKWTARLLVPTILGPEFG